jgi:hypothetical protein
LVSFQSSEDGVWHITVRDSGIGMTLDTVLDYFLSVGASYRRSDAWREQFQNSMGESLILRSGRFGIGVLASFLLGDEIRVETRHITTEENKGICFSTTLNESPIELHYARLPIGTTITVTVSGYRASRLSNFFEDRYPIDPPIHDFYCLPDPVIRRVLLPRGEILEPMHNLPMPESPLPPEWSSLDSPGFQEIQWTFADAPKLSCNGFIVGETPRLTQDVLGPKWPIGPYKTPNVSVFDPDGNFPLNLQRTGLAQQTYPFAEALMEEVLKDHLAFLLVRGPSRLSPDAFTLDLNWWH